MTLRETVLNEETLPVIDLKNRQEAKTLEGSVSRYGTEEAGWPLQLRSLMQIE